MNKKGFTLIELLAVIVVLAIVAVLGISQVLPMIKDARKEAFVTEANYAVEAAENAMGKIVIDDSIDKSKYSKEEVEDGTDYTFTLEGLKEIGVYNKKDTSKYRGKVTVHVPSGNKRGYTYTVTMDNGEYYINKVRGEVTKSDVEEEEPDDYIANLNNNEGISWMYYDDVSSAVSSNFADVQSDGFAYRSNTGVATRSGIDGVNIIVELCYLYNNKLVCTRGFGYGNSEFETYFQNACINASGTYSSSAGSHTCTMGDVSCYYEQSGFGTCNYPYVIYDNGEYIGESTSEAGIGPDGGTFGSF